jgi:hypothetical protein
VIHKLINMHKVKFNVLKEVLTPYAERKIVNIHIDLHSILGELYKIENYGESNWLEDDNSMAISSCIINMAAHYRLFFHNHFKASVRIFFYFANSRPRNNVEYLSSYGYKFFDKYSLSNEEFSAVNAEVSTNLKLCKTIMEYLPGVYYIDCKNIEPIVAASHIMMKYPEPNLVLTKDEYWFQCVNILSPTSVLRLKRDESFLVDVTNVYEMLLKKVAFRPKFLLSDSLSVVYAFGGVKSRDVRGLTGYGYAKIAKILDMAIDRHLIQPTYTNIKNILDEIYSGKQTEELIVTFKAVDLRFQLNELTTAQKESLNDCLTFRYNRKDLLALNQKHYTGDNSLMLEELFRGTERIDNFKW